MPLRLILDVLSLVIVLYELLSKLIRSDSPVVDDLLVNPIDLVADDGCLNVEEEHKGATYVEFVLEILYLDYKVPD